MEAENGFGEKERRGMHVCLVVTVMMERERERKRRRERRLPRTVTGFVFT